ncbi:MAG: ABC transporter ATP-binding protein [Halobacteriales archaeon]
MSAEPVPIALAGLEKRFEDVQALDGVDLSVSGPEILGLAGPNGSGKTTLIRCLLGLLRPSAGSAEVDGTTSRRLSGAERARIGYMPQGEALYDDLSVRGNVAFFARLYGVEDRHAAVDRALALVDLDDRTDAMITELSGGMVRRTSLACAVVHDPDLLVLDEPTVGLDPELRASMWDTFREWREAGTTVLVSTHYLGEVDRCDRVLFLRNGRELTLDSPAAIRERTGTDSLEAAFLALLDQDATTAAAGGADA